MDDRAGDEDLTGESEHHPGHGVPFPIRKVDVHLPGEVLDRNPPRDQPSAVADMFENRAVRAFGDVPEQLLGHIFDGHDPHGHPVFVDHDRQVVVLHLHVLEQARDDFRLGNRENGMGYVDQRRGAFMADGDQLSKLHHPQDVLQAPPIDGQTAVAAAQSQVHCFVGREIRLHCNDVRAGDHDVVDPPVAEPKGTVDQLEIFLGDLPLLSRLDGEEPQLLLGDG